MKPVLAAALFLIAVALSPSAWAQPATDAGAELRTLVEQTRTPEAKRAAVASALALTDAEAKKFWPIYDTYQRKLDTTNRQLSRTYEDMVMSGRPISDAWAKNLARDLAEADENATRARKAMYGSAVKVLPGRKAIRYLQIENKLEAAYRYEIASTLPLVK